MKDGIKCHYRITAVPVSVSLGPGFQLMSRYIVFWGHPLLKL
jgi:hypothetical protein